MRASRVIFTIVLLAVLVLVAALLWHRVTSDPPRAASTARDAGGPPASAWMPITESKLSHGRFQQLYLFSPHAAPRGVVLLLSDADGWTAAMAGIARGLAARGALVVGIDDVQFNAALAADGAGCVFPDGDLENLSHFIQAYAHLPNYLPPLLAGRGTGGTLAYATLVQAPADTFAGAVSIGFCPTYSLDKPLCPGSGLQSKSRAPQGVTFLPSARLTAPWVVVAVPPPHPAAECDTPAVQAFVAQVPGGRLIVPDAALPPSSDTAAFDAWFAATAQASAGAPAALKDLPLVEVPAQSALTADAFALMLSGDGGWAGIDKEVAAALSADGIPVVGLDSLRYFWTARTPEGLAADLDRTIRFYLPKFKKQRVLLIGYSQGADVLPFAVNRLPAATRAQVALTTIMGMSEHALFEFHLTSWMSDDASGPATLPEVDTMRGAPLLCIYGAEEDDSLCPRLDPHRVTVVKVPGGHHFDGNYAALARTILAAVPH